MVGILGVLAGILGVLVGILGVLVSVLGVLVGLLGVLVSLLGVFGIGMVRSLHEMEHFVFGMVYLIFSSQTRPLNLKVDVYHRDIKHIIVHIWPHGHMGTYQATRLPGRLETLPGHMGPLPDRLVWSVIKM